MLRIIGGIGIMFLVAFGGVALEKSYAGEPPAAAAPTPVLKDTMNGMRMSDFEGFYKDWHLVTSRFRKDSNETRLTYANDLAWQTMLAGKTDYPDGAVFAKIPMFTGDDPDFVNSAAPVSVSHYQFMVMDSKKYKTTHGWGYSVFDTSGKNPLTPEEEVQKVDFCNACHEMVPQRGYVFSQAMPFEKVAAMAKAAPPASALPEMGYQDMDVAKLPEKIRTLIPSEYKTVRSMTGIFVKKAFSGTLYELRPALIKESITSKMPALLLVEKQHHYTVVFPDVKTPGCTTEAGEKGVFIKGFQTYIAPKNLRIAKGEVQVFPFQTCAAAPG